MIGRAVPRLCLALALATGCSSGEPDGGRGAAAGDAAAVEPSWTGRSPSGAVVRVRPERFPLEPGPVRFHVTVDSVAGPVHLSADLVSPGMPVHGITRFAAARAADGGYDVVTEIPMAGRWMLYVNLDDGDDAVPFEFDVVPADSAGGASAGSHEHHSPDPGR